MTDYRDFFKKNKLNEWDKDHRYAKRLRELNCENATYDTFKKAIENEDPEISANAIIGLIKLTCYLLDRQIKFLEKEFIQKGGLRERMYKARKQIK